MPNDPRLENYLAQLERALSPFPTTDRVDIVMEIKGHILQALERDPNSNLDSILSALGAADTVANRYLMERGLKPTKPSISPAIKWIVIGFLGTSGMLFSTLLILFFHFTPIVKINENGISLLGGSIQINEHDANSGHRHE